MKTTLVAAAAALLLAATPASHADTAIVLDLVGTHGADTIAVGDLHLFNRRALETPPNARNAGGFLSIYNYASDANRLISASSPVAERVELHTMTMDNDVMRMRELEDGIELPGETQVDLEPGGLHVMFINLSGPFVEGDQVPVTLVFEGGEEKEITLPVEARSMDMNHGSSDDMSGHDGHDHGHDDSHHEGHN
jgi:hypothetical protein